MAPQKGAAARRPATSQAPWDAAPPHEQLFVLITGANSGIGLGIGERLIDEFLATRSLSSRLVLLPTTRSAAKSRQTIRALRAHANRVAQTSETLRARAGGEEEYQWEDAARRVHVLSLELDLCDIRGVYALAARLCGGTVGNPDGVEGPDAELRDVRVPRLDSVVFNAAYGGWSGCNYPMAVWHILTDGLVQSVTWPTFKVSLPTRILNEQPAYKYPAKPSLGEVFSACVFGHYLLARQLLPLLRRSHDSPTTPGRIIWSSSVEAVGAAFDPNDMQALRSRNCYESAKRFTDILSLSHTLPSVQPFSSDFLRGDDEDEDDAWTPPKMYLTHPGVVASTLFPVPWFLFWAYRLALILARWIGSPWHTVDSYSGACSTAWLALQEQEALDAADGERVKWGSSANRLGAVFVKKTEVDGWGWEGKVEGVSNGEDGAAERILGKKVGRQRGVVDVTEKELAKFEELGRECWEQMEDLREEWEEILDL